MAREIMKLKTFDTSVARSKALVTSEALSIFFDGSLSNLQKYALIAERLSMTVEGWGPNEWIHVGFIRVKYMLMSLAKFDEALPASYPISCYITNEDRETLYQELNRLESRVSETITPTVENSFAPLIGYTTFMIGCLKFYIEWRSGNMQDAYDAAVRAIDFMEENASLIGIWFHSTAQYLMPIPYFFQEYGATEMALEVLQLFETAFDRIGKKEKFEVVLREMNWSTAAQSCFNIAQIEQELLNPLSDLLQPPNFDEMQSILFTSSDPSQSLTSSICNSSEQNCVPPNNES